MRPKKVEQTELLTAVMGVFRNKGYDGSSLNELAKASGLKKASLYHRFPGGKQEIALAVLSYVENEIDSKICQLLMDNSIDTETRVAKVVNNINQLYRQGKETSILRAMSLDTDIGPFDEQIKRIMEKWLAAFKAIGKELGMDEAESNYNAQQSLVLVQGSLIVSKVMGIAEPFETALMKIRVMFMP